MDAENITVMVVSAADGKPLDKPSVFAYRRASLDEFATQTWPLRFLGENPQYEIMSYAEFLAGAAPDPAVLYGDVSPGWNECLDDPEWGWDPDRLNAVVFGPGFSDDERYEAARLVVNDDDFGGGLSMARVKWLYDAYPLRSGAVAVRVSGPEGEPLVKRYDSVDAFFQECGDGCRGDDLGPLNADHEEAEWFAAHIENEGRDWPEDAYPPLGDGPDQEEDDEPERP
ncbi:hypothetical protein [Paracoccus sanguinis]|uniref:Uncharacterized protein n=1 Tax=Paracoccus sanguinis TaxID=1545044 RepID=A0A099GNW7_9RHOB|nr:hypothetical protein [Paracoccus sanguinis]KGJ23773.1 hypothetical protein IX56_00420 [Paracoccus sanguinis]